MNEENKVSYYSVIPATVLFSKDLKPNENFDIFIQQIIEKIINVIDLDFK